MPEYGMAMIIDPAIAGQFGDLIGGVTGPILSLVGIYYVVQTFREQRQTNLEERKAEETEAFERRYYEMLRIHRENVSEMKTDAGSEGRLIFVKLLGEIQLAIEQIMQPGLAALLKLSFGDQLQVAYYCVFFGVGPNSNPSLRAALKAAEIPLTDEQFDSLAKVLTNVGQRGTGSFKGQQHRLGHYYRHLYQAVAYVHLQKISNDEKKDFVKTIRAQLSTHEQGLLLINSLSGMGWEWWRNGFIKDYAMVKNLPRGFVEAYYSLDVEDLFGQKYFEYQQSPEKPKPIGQLKKWTAEKQALRSHETSNSSQQDN